jgi:penicillin-binding protein 1C
MAPQKRTCNIFDILEFVGAIALLLVGSLGFITRSLVPRIIPKPHSVLLIEVLFLKAKLKFWQVPKPTPFLFFLLSLIFFLYATSSLMHLLLDDMPSPTDLANRPLAASTKIYDRNGVLLYQIYKDQNRTIIPLRNIPRSAQLATLAAEDAEFYSHPGFSLRGIIRSLIKNIREGKVTGGSTITQQLVKNAFLSSEKTVLRKIKEIIISIRVEGTYSKDQILEMYLNEVSYGNTAYGIEEAAKVYFGKSAHDLTLSESALLAGLPQSPTLFSPYGPDPFVAKNRQKEVLTLMVNNKFITEQDAQNAINQKLVFAPRNTGIKAPHFVMYVKDLLAQRYGEEMVEQGGLEVRTTLDYQVQKLAEEVVKNEIDKLARLHVTNAAVVVLHPQTGEILAMVGSYDYFDASRDGNVNVTLRPRSPGSSIKIVTYATALAHGFTPATVILDAPISIPLQGQPIYIPKNYDGQFRGNLLLRQAFAESRNIPAVKTLMSVGLNNVIDQGRKMGITTWEDSRRFGPSLTLGGGEVKLLDLSQVYATIANRGNRPKIQSILEVKTYKNNILEESSCTTPFTSGCDTVAVVDPRIAYLLTDILRDNNARTPAFGAHSSLLIPNHPEVAVKTGTSNDLRDNLTVGFNQYYLIAVWVGNNDNSPMGRIASGITGAAPIWNQIMSSLIAHDPSKNWDVPQGLVSVPICQFTGTLACGGCPTKMEWFLEGSQPLSHCPAIDLNRTPDPSPMHKPQQFQFFHWR